MRLISTVHLMQMYDPPLHSRNPRLTTAQSLHLLARYFTAYPEDADKVTVCIKSGIRSFQPMVLDCSPTYMREAVNNAVKILAGKKTIDVFGPCRVDPNTPIEDTISALAEVKKEGKINGIQLSEVSASTIRRAAEVTKIDMVEAEVSLWYVSWKPISSHFWNIRVSGYL
ncbi:MAG: hypothetical protein CL912_09225 [Deltaproteobacteria bacterium]|nr:hypothetical protein [Deltaproteobacteria bacterium]